jgi:type II secretory pathway pseudopilin PulG
MSAPSARGNTLIELLTLLTVMAVLAAVVVPGAMAARRVLAGAAGSQRLALVLRAAQAEAQARHCRVDVMLGAGGSYEVRADDAPLDHGDLGAGPETNYPSRAVSFSASGSPCLLATATPRAGSFSFGSGAGRTVVVQLGGCIRCR